MNSVTIDPEVATRLESYRQSETESEIHRVVNDALRQYLRSLERQKLRQEQEAFEEQYPQLRHEHSGHYVAFHQGQLVDTDENERTLYIRVHKRFPNTVIGIFPVDETSEMRAHRHLSTRLSPPNRGSDSFGYFEEDILIGRNVTNQLRLLLDGPDESVELLM